MSGLCIQVDHVYEKYESVVRSYCRNYPVKFGRASGPFLYGSDKDKYIDFLSGCGSLNYGHNDPHMKAKLIKYISEDNICCGLDMHTEAKTDFLSEFTECILNKRGLNYRVQFTGPTGANAVEAAVKLARKVTGRLNIACFTNGFHGCSLGALALTGNSYHRAHNEPLLGSTQRLFFYGYLGSDIDTADVISKVYEDESSGFAPPAAFILEPVQGEGGLNVASRNWARSVQRIARKMDALLIVDEIQTGSGRTGTFFSFEQLQIEPDIVVLAKSISGFGLPMSLVLIRPDLDIWAPGEHNGTFRGNNHALVTATEALRTYWANDKLEIDLAAKAEFLTVALDRLANVSGGVRKGKGMMQGLELADSRTALSVRAACFEYGLILELCGPKDTVVKLMPPLNIKADVLEQGLDRLSRAILDVV